jgi:hypothetical protein
MVAQRKGQRSICKILRDGGLGSIKPWYRLTLDSPVSCAAWPDKRGATFPSPSSRPDLCFWSMLLQAETRKQELLRWHDSWPGHWVWPEQLYELAEQFNIFRAHRISCRPCKFGAAEDGTHLRQVTEKEKKKVTRNVHTGVWNRG